LNVGKAEDWRRIKSWIVAKLKTDQIAYRRTLFATKSYIREKIIVGKGHIVVL